MKKSQRTIKTKFELCGPKENWNWNRDQNQVMLNIQSRSGAIWTRDLLCPRQIQYQAMLHSVFYYKFVSLVWCIGFNFCVMFYHTQKTNYIRMLENWMKIFGLLSSMLSKPKALFGFGWLNEPDRRSRQVLSKLVWIKFVFDTCSASSCAWVCDLVKSQKGPKLGLEPCQIFGAL